MFNFLLQTEQIRRVNRLWASDSLFLREHLLIPASPDKSLLTAGEFSSFSESFDGSSVSKYLT